MHYYIVLLHILGREPEGSQAQMIVTATKTLLIAKFVVSHCAFCKFQRNFGCFCSVNHLSEPLENTCLLVIGAFRSTLFVSVFQGSLLMIALFHTVSGLDQLVFIEAFYDLFYSCLLQK